MGNAVKSKPFFNTLTPSDAVRKQKKKIEDLFSSVLLKFKKYPRLVT